MMKFNLLDVLIMFKLSDTSKRLVKVMFAVSLIGLGIGIIVTQVWFPLETFKYVYGIVFGMIFSVLKLVLLERTLNKSVNFSQGQAQNYVRLHYMLRYFLTGAVLVVAAVKGISALIGVVVCLMSLRPAIHIVNWQYKKQEKQDF